MHRRDVSKALIASALASRLSVEHADAAATRTPPDRRHASPGRRYAATPAEKAAKVVPVDLRYPPGHVYRYGANTNPGTTDMTGPINQALSCNKTVYAPAGTYLCSASLKLISDQTFYGDGAETILTWSNPAIHNIVGLGIKNTVIRDLKIQVTASSSSTITGGLLFANNSTGCKAERVEITGVNWAGVWICGSSHCEVRGCYFHDFLGSQSNGADVMISDDNGGVNRADGNVVADNRCFGGGWFGVAVMQYFGVGPVLPSNNLVTGNRIDQHEAYGILFYNVKDSGDVTNRAVGNRIENIVGKVITKNSGAGIYVASAGGCVITGNTVRNCGIATSAETLTPAGIGLVYSGGAPNLAPFTVSDNIIEDHHHYYGIEVVGSLRGGVISGNVVNFHSAAPKAGIYVLASSNVKVIGNTVNIATSLESVSGIFVFAAGRACDNISITGNTIIGATRRGIELNQQGGFNVSGFEITGNSLVRGSSACVPIGIASAVNGTVTGNIASADTLPALLVSASTGVRYADNVLNTTGGVSVRTSGTCTNSYFYKSNSWNAPISNEAAGLSMESAG